MSLREKVEDHILWFSLSLVVTGFVAGFGAHAALSNALTSQVTGTQQGNWEELAKSADWIPKGDCAAYPVSLTIAGPGSGSTVDVSNFEASASSLDTDLVVQANRPLPQSNAVGLITNEPGTPNYYVSFPPFDSDDARKVFRETAPIILGEKLNDKSTELNMWALLTDSSAKFGAVYSGLDQIRASDPNATLSAKVSLKVNPK